MTMEAQDMPPADWAGAEAAGTGLPSVDQVLAALEGLEQRPLEEHVGLFERVHEQLRRALDSHPQPQG